MATEDQGMPVKTLATGAKFPVSSSRSSSDPLSQASILIISLLFSFPPAPTGNWLGDLAFRARKSQRCCVPCIEDWLSPQ